MTPVPFDLLVRPSEVSELANLIFDHAERKPLSDELRNRIAARAATMRRETVTPYFGSLERDPVHPSTYYLAVDGVGRAPLLLHIALATAPASGLFPKSTLVGRMRRTGGPEILANYVPFGPGDYENIGRYLTLNGLFRPQPLGTRPCIIAAASHPEVTLPAAFDAFRTILKSTGLNLASAGQLSAAGQTSEQLYQTCVWAAIRAGWRETFAVAAGRITVSGRTPEEVSRSLECARETIRGVAIFSKFTADATALFAPQADAGIPGAWSDAEVEGKFEKLFPAEERSWVLDEFAGTLQAGDGRYEFSESEAMRLAVKFGQALKACEQLYDTIREVRVARRLSRVFDFELALDRAGTLTTARELVFCLHWWKSGGRVAQLVSPNFGFDCPQHAAAGAREELFGRIKELSEVGRHFQTALDIHSSDGLDTDMLDGIGKATVGKLTYTVSKALEQPVLEALSEQPEGSEWRALPADVAAEVRKRVAGHIISIAEHVFA